MNNKRHAIMMKTSMINCVKSGKSDKRPFRKLIFIIFAKIQKQIR